MDHTENPLIRLQDLAGFLEGDNFDDNLQRLTKTLLVAAVLNAENCSLMSLMMATSIAHECGSARPFRSFACGRLQRIGPAPARE